MKVTQVNRKKVPLRIFILAGLAALSGIIPLFPDAAPANEERPEIIVPRVSGRELFQNCVLCHKYDGTGGATEGGYAANLQMTVLTRDEIIAVITNGRFEKGMPPFRDVLDADKIKTLATFIKEGLKATQ